MFINLIDRRELVHIQTREPIQNNKVKVKFIYRAHSRTTGVDQSAAQEKAARAIQFKKYNNTNTKKKIKSVPFT